MLNDKGVVYDEGMNQVERRHIVNALRVKKTYPRSMSEKGVEPGEPCPPNSKEPHNCPTY